VAFEIGGAFFLAVLFMVGTMTGSVFPKIGKSIKLTLCCLSVLALCYITLSNFPEAYAAMVSIVSDSPTPSPKPALPANTKTTAPARAAVAKPWPKSAGKVSEIEYVIKVEPKPAATAADAPAALDAEPKADGRRKKVLKSIGRAFHIGKKEQ
jgi:hypothetical protein